MFYSNKNIFSVLIHAFSIFIVISLFCSCKTSKNISSTTKHDAIQKKYASILQTNETQITSINLYSLIDEWMGAPYKYAGKTKSGIDCSGFASILYENIYKKTLSGSSANIFNQCEEIKMKDIKEGDLLFFKIEQDKISHIGIYLMNNKFVHASTQKGVIISDLNEAYYKKYFYKAGRLK